MGLWETSPGCGGRALWGNPSQAVVFVASLFVNLPSSVFSLFLPTPRIKIFLPGGSMCIYTPALRPYVILFILKILSMLSMIRDIISVTVNL